jgi:hypothetical protein
VTPAEEQHSISYWQGTVDGELKAQGTLILNLQASLDRVESKVNSVKNAQERASGGFRVGALVGGFAGSTVLVIFGAFVTRVFS